LFKIFTEKEVALELLKSIPSILYDNTVYLGTTIFFECVCLGVKKLAFQIKYVKTKEKDCTTLVTPLLISRSWHIPYRYWLRVIQIIIIRKALLPDRPVNYFCLLLSLKPFL